MKKIILLGYVFLFAITNCMSQAKKIELEYQNDDLIQNIGIGLVQLVKVKQDIILYEDNNCTKIKTKKAKLGKDIIPMLYKPDYGILFFVCTEKTTKYYKIATKNAFVYVKPSADLIFYNWNDFLKNQVMSVESKKLKENPFRISIKGKSINTTNWNSDDEIEILKVQGTWIQLKNETQDKLCWIEWRSDKTLKIFLNLLI